MKKICMGSLLGLFLLAATVQLYYTGYIIDIVDHDGDHITLGLDGDGNGVAEFTHDFYGVSDEELQTLRDAKRDGKQVTINYHNTGGKLYLDGVQILGSGTGTGLQYIDGIPYQINPGTGALQYSDPDYVE